MKVDIFFKNKVNDISKTFYLGTLEIANNLLEELSEDQREDFIQGMILTSLSDNIEWIPISEDSGEKIKHDYKFN